MTADNAFEDKQAQVVFKDKYRGRSGKFNIDDKHQEGTKKNNKYVNFREKKVSMMVICLLLTHSVA